MSLRWKFALSLGALSAIAAIAASFAGYATTRDQLLGQIDRSISASAHRAAEQRSVLGALPAEQLGAQRGPRMPGMGPPLGGPGDEGLGNRLVIVQELSPSGKPTELNGVALPIDTTDRQLAASGVVAPVRFRDSDVSGVSVRIATIALAGGGAIQVARDIGEATSTLSNLRTKLLLITLIVIAAAIAIGLLLARGATASLKRLTDTAERVSESGSPDAEVTVTGNDEVGRLGRAFAQMLAALNRSKQQQQQLVEDAGHELRTPLTSIRTNVAVLDRFDELSAGDRKSLTADLASETEELAQLVDELVQLSINRDEEPAVSVDLHRLAVNAGERAERRSGRQVIVVADDATVEALPRTLERAISNLLDNAMKFDSSGGPIELRVSASRIEVLDRGPGIPEEQREKVFERFYRTDEARSVPGSGLGLAIVRDAAERHAGTTFATPREGGGSVVGITLGDTPRD